MKKGETKIWIYVRETQRKNARNRGGMWHEERFRALQQTEEVTGELRLSRPRSLKCCGKLRLGDNLPDYGRSKSNQPWPKNLSIVDLDLSVLPVVVSSGSARSQGKPATSISLDVCVLIINTVGLRASSLRQWRYLVLHCFPHWLRWRLTSLIWLLVFVSMSLYVSWPLASFIALLQMN